jgi:hypothetical protein
VLGDIDAAIMFPTFFGAAKKMLGERGEFALGCATHPRRIAQARV